MSASADTKLQVNFKTAAGDLINLYATDEDELSDLLESFGRLSGKVSEVGALLRTAAGASAALAAPAVPSAPEPARFPAPRQAPAQESFGGAPSCAHGSMTERSSKPGAARAWSAYFCSGPKNDQCKPIDAKTGKPWG